MITRLVLQSAWLLSTACMLSRLSTILSASAEGGHFDVSEHRCADEHGLGSIDHEAALDRLDGKRIVFIGDASVRYQYLELAYYLTYGRCPDPEEEPFILNQANFDSFQNFYKVSSELLNVRRSSLRSREVCLCVRLSLEPGDIEEQRSYVYEDDKGRKVELMYEQYFKEAYGRLQTIVAAARGLHPTDIVISYGFWQRGTGTSCGAGTGDAQDCPGLPWLCGLLVHQPPGHNLWWLTVPPTSWNGKIVDSVSWGHHLHIPRRCYLPTDIVLDRAAVLRSMESDPAKLLGLWLGSNTTDLTPDAYHAFNRQLLAKLKPEQRNLTEPQWFKWLPPDDL